MIIFFFKGKTTMHSAVPKKPTFVDNKSNN